MNGVGTSAAAAGAAAALVLAAGAGLAGAGVVACARHSPARSTNPKHRGIGEATAARGTSVGHC